MENTQSSWVTDSYKKQMQSNSHDLQTLRPWNLCGKKIWGLEVLNKFKNLVWWACTNSLPTKVNLVHCKIIFDGLCDIYRIHQEDTNHTLYYRPMLDPLWNQTPMWNHDALKCSKTFIDIIESVFASNKNPWLFSLVIWNLWNHQNSLRLGKAALPLNKITKHSQERQLEAC